jgi:hypothetical protein
MKKVLLTSLILGSSIASFAQNPRVVSTSPGGAFDSFDAATEYSDTEGSDPALGIYFWNDTNNIAVPYFKRVAAVPSELTDGVLKSQKVRSGNGEIAFTVSQPHGLFSPQVGVTFGAGKSLNLTGASSLTLKIGFKMDLTSLAAVASTAKGIKVKFSLKDANDVGIDAFGKLGGTSNQWKDELYILINKTTGEFTASPDLSKTNPPITFDATKTPGVTYVTVNFATVGTDLGYEALYPTLTKGSYIDEESCVATIKGDGGIFGASTPKTGFDASKVAGFAITLLQAEQIAGDCHFNTALTDLSFSITEFNLGNIAVGLTEDELFNANNTVSVYDMMGSFIATGKLKELNLTSGKLYIVKSGNKSKKIIMN